MARYCNILAIVGDIIKIEVPQGSSSRELGCRYNDLALVELHRLGPTAQRIIDRAGWQ